MKERLIDFTNDVALGLGLDYPISFTIPLYDAMRNISYIRLFLDQVHLPPSWLTELHTLSHTFTTPVHLTRSHTFTTPVHHIRAEVTCGWLIE